MSFVIILLMSFVIIQVIGHVPDMEEADVQTAVDSAYEAFQSWRKTTAKVICCKEILYLKETNVSVIAVFFGFLYFSTLAGQ